MRKLLSLLSIIACFSVQAVYGEGQSQRNNALSNMDAVLGATDEATTPEDEYYLGRAVAANILAIYPPYTQNQELTRYLNRICQTIAINSPQPEIYNGYHVVVLDSSQLNAFATPGGHILITRGLIATAQSEDMLAAIIAHELAHILLKHSESIIADMRLNDELTATATRAGTIAARESQEAARAVLFRNSVTRLVDAMVQNGYSQAQEFEADTTAITLLAASGYNPDALLEVLQLLRQTANAQSVGVNATHPSPAERITNANKMTGRYRIQDTRSYRVNRFMNK